MVPGTWEEIAKGEFKRRRGRVAGIDLADGGYLTWLYGSSPHRMMGWPPEFVSTSVIAMDSQFSNRQERSPHYKSARLQRREENDSDQETWVLVKSFQKSVREDPRLSLIEIRGCEADDLIGLAAWKFGDPSEPLSVFGTDKDLLQIGPYFSLTNREGESLSLERWHEGLPKALQSPNEVLEPWMIPILLSLLGDSSDSIPRVAERGLTGLRKVGHILWGTDDPWGEFDRIYPEAQQNLYDTLLPDPFLFGIEPEELTEVLKGDLWNPQMLRRLTPRLRRQVHSWTLRR